MSTRLQKLGGLIFLTAVALATRPATAQTDVVFIGEGVANWDDASNWDPGNIPEGDFDEIAIIGSGSSAFVSNMPPDPGGIEIANNGTLEIRSGGDLTAISTLPSGTVAGNLSVDGSLLVRRGGTLNAEFLEGGGSIVLGEVGSAGTAALSVDGGQFNGVARIVGPNVALSSSGNLTIGGTLIPVITGTAHSVINVAGTATLNGTVQVEFEGYQPQFGDSWGLVTAGQISGGLTVDPASIPAGTPRGATFTVTTSDTTATLSLTNRLLMTVNRASGAVQIENVLGDPITIDAYTIASPSGLLGGNWNSLHDQGGGDWDEADNSGDSRLTELNPQGSSIVDVGQTMSLGTPFAPPAPSALGEVQEDLTFQYGFAGEQFDGIVEYVGPRNNLVLTIDPATGQAAIQNESPFFDVSIDGYTITSASGDLVAGNGNWNSLQDQSHENWEEADNADNFRLTELKPGGGTMLNGGGTVLNLGTPVDVSGGPLSPSDFTFQFAVAGGADLMDGIVHFGTIPEQIVGGDFNGDGVVNAADYTVWRDTLGSTGSDLAADANGDETVNDSDYAIWESNFGRMFAAGSNVTHSSVPEPGSCLLILLNLVALAMTRIWMPASLIRN